MATIKRIIGKARLAHKTYYRSNRAIVATITRNPDRLEDRNITLNPARLATPLELCLHFPLSGRMG